MTSGVDGVYPVRIVIPNQLIVEIEPIENNTLLVTSGTGESYELDGDAFSVLTGLDWQNLVTEM